MRFYIVILTLLSCGYFIYGQAYERNDRKVVFVDGANLREKASLNAKIISTLKQGQEVIVCHRGYIADTINGVIAVWYPVLHNGNLGYLWENTLATNTFTHSNGNRLLVKNDAKGLSYKVLQGDSLIRTGSYPDRPYSQYTYVAKVHPLFAVPNHIYFKLASSDLLYSFDGLHVASAGRCDKENIDSFHLSAHEEVKGPMGSIVNGDKVNLRSAPSTNAKIIGQLPKYTVIQEIEQQQKRETINDEENYWYKIKWQGKDGYIWGSFISSPLMHIYDNDDRNTTYLLCQNGLFVLRKRKIVAHCKFKWAVNDETLHSFGDLGFGSGYDFVAIESIAHSCGEWGGDTYYLWDGKNIKRFCSSGGVGDGGLSDGEEYTFPSESGGIPGKLIKYSYAYEMIELIPIDPCETDYTSAIGYQSSAVMGYNGDTLVELPSKHADLRLLVQHKFPKYQLIQYEFGDINADNIEDVVFQVNMYTQIKDNNGDYRDSYKVKVGVAMGTKDGKLEIFSTNEHMVSEYDDSRINIALNKSNILITSYYDTGEQVGYQEIHRLGRKLYNFVYHPTDQKIYWESVSTIDANGLRKSTFKTKKISFENTWSFSDIGEYQEK